MACMLLEVEGEGEGKKKKILLESPGNISLKKNGNYKEILKNNILIKIEFWDAGGIVNWYGIMIKWLFGMIMNCHMK